MIGYKAFNRDLTCRGFQYEIGKTYSIKGLPILCQKGFHFCENIADTYRYYPMSDNTRICKIEAIGEIVTENNIKYCTNKIKILEEITNDCERKGNTNSSNSGYRNSGYCNSGNWNSGDCNSGYRNSGYCNSGNWNSGDYNSGYRNSGNRNSGNRNSGYKNSGDCNSGDCNSGDWNSGNRNSGDWNSGDCNSGNWNSGYKNSGNWNSGNWNSGLFNSEENPKLKMFNNMSDWTINDWNDSDARHIMNTCPYTHSDFIDKSDMTDEEKENHPEYKTIGGFVKVFIVTKKEKEDWWNKLSDEDKDIIKSLPNFDFDIFRKCVGF